MRLPKVSVKNSMNVGQRWQKMHEVFFRQGIEIGRLLDPQGPDGNTLVQQHGYATVGIAFPQIAFEGSLSPACIVIKFGGALLNDVEVVDARLSLNE